MIRVLLVGTVANVTFAVAYWNFAVIFPVFAQFSCPLELPLFLLLSLCVGDSHIAEAEQGLSMGVA